ncbi:MAG: Alanine-tRNA ligase [Parcubacteria group bacterium GW2011_GWC1_45_9]|nr:MAG: Alanine-tRNA ligase [Parcubacteria group bacterium GW2011_GWC1_45_9]
MKITAKQLRQKYLDFFKEKGHTIISSASLIPENDPTVLFTTAGMHPLVPYLMGEKHPGGKRLVNVQKCLRTDDIDEVGDTVHQTFFEMLGNWSLGDYFKKDAIEWSLEFLTSSKWLGLEKEKLAVSVFAGDPSTGSGQAVPKDNDSAEIWKSLGISESRISYLPRKNNWWGPAGLSGPCGPDTEIFYWTGKELVPDVFESDDARWVEVWNNVFMQYNKKIDGSFELLKQQNVDTGMGLARTVAVLNSVFDNYQTDLYFPVIQEIEKLSGKKYLELEEITKAMRIIADHLTASVFVLAEKLEPSNTERGYVLRRLIRRAVRYGKQLGMDKPFCSEISETVIKTYQGAYPEVLKNKEFIKSELDKEEERFSKTLEAGLRELNKLFLVGEIQRIAPGQEIKTFNRVDAKKAFFIYQSYGFPLEMIQEELAKRLLIVDEKEFEEEMKKHQELSRRASAGVFKGGLQDHSEISTRYHSATHLLQAALRKVLGEHVYQKGSNITAERLRFDFPHPKEITPDQIKQVEDLINEKIKESLPVHFEEMELEKAKQLGALGVFESKYGEKVKVYFVGVPQNYFSVEICGGPHVENTGEIKGLKIQKVESIGQGIKRIRAVIS